MAEPDNMVLLLLREMRQDTEGRLGERLDRMEKRLDTMQLNGMKALESVIGHRTTVGRPFASFDDQVGGREVRVTALESARA